MKLLLFLCLFVAHSVSAAKQCSNNTKCKDTVPQELSWNEPLFESPVLDACGGKIDWVVTWVNGSDPVRLQLTRDYWDKTYQNHYEPFPENRWREYGSLYYALISLQRNAPWTNKIYVITSDHQVPTFLEDENLRKTVFSKVVLVQDDEIWQEPKYLPNFNSHAYETQIHRVPELSECFVYICDDFYLTRKAKPEEFFQLEKDGQLRPIVYLDNYGLHFEQVAREHEMFKYSGYDRRHRGPEYESYGNSWVLLRSLDAMVPDPRNPYEDDPRLMKATWPGRLLSHAGRPVLKSDFAVILNQSNEQILETCGHKFREQTDYHAFGLYYWHSQAKTLFKSAEVDETSVAFHMLGQGRTTPKDFAEELSKTVFAKDFLWFSVNDDLSERFREEFLNLFHTSISILLCQRKTFGNVDIYDRANFTPVTREIMTRYGFRCGFQS